jgi:predicted metal-dependent HD superfamily phosphohydrolase
VSDAHALASWVASLPPAWTESCDVRAIERARAAYESSGRHYHTWQHVINCVGQLETFTCENPRAIFLALVFHDAVYVAGRVDNESESALLARDTLSELCYLPALELESIERMILATRDHHAQAGMMSLDEATMLDIDLSILGVARHEYERYAREIHDEYVPWATTDPRFRFGRLEFLRAMRSMPSVFLTTDAQRRWEDAARANMAWEAAKLTEEQGWLERLLSAVHRMRWGRSA